MPTPVYAQGVIAGDNPSVTVTQVPSDYTWNITLVTTPATSGTFIVMSGVRIIGSGTLGATIGPFTAYGDEQITVQVTGTGIAGSTVAITGLAYSRGETVPPVSPIPASATNIVSGSVNVTAGSISLNGGTLDGIVNPIISNVPSSPAGIIPNNTADKLVGTAAGTYQILANSSGTTQYMLVAIQITGNPTNTAQLTVQASGTSTITLLDLRVVSGNFINNQYSLYGIILPVGAGVSATQNANNLYGVTLYYVSIDNTNPYVQSVKVQV